MPASHPPAHLLPRLPPAALEPRDEDAAEWGESCAVFELPALAGAGLRPFDDTPAAPATEAPPIGDVGRLFSDYRAYVAKIGRRILGPSSDVDDLIQDVFLATVRDSHKIKDPARLSAWLGTVTTRMAKRRRFRGSQHPLVNNDLDDLIDVAREEGPGPESTADLSGNIEKLLSLPDELRTPWLLKHVEGHTLEAVAKQCDCSLSTAARRIQSASSKLGRRG